MPAQIENISGQYQSFAAVQDKKISAKAKPKKDRETELFYNSKMKTDNKNNSDLNEYSRYLQKKFTYFNKSVSISNVPVTVSVSPEFLKKCVDNPQKAEFLESNLSVIPQCVQSAVQYTRTMKGSPVMTYMSYTIDADGNISCASGCTNDPDGKIARENAQKNTEAAREDKKELEKRKNEKKKAEKREEKKQQAEILQRNKSMEDYVITAAGIDIKGITQSIAVQTTSVYISGLAVSGFDAKA